jgi:indolepyruvate ferredoxin oxidoreductase beta subunit
MKCDVLIAGVGGQGQVLASRLIGAAALDMGLDARTSETIGMSQRGGCVTSNVRIGGGVLSPAVPQGEADVIIGFELCETVRNLSRLANGGGVVLNNQIISPVAVSLGLMSYESEKMMDYIRGNVKRLIVIDAMKLASEAGLPKAANVVMLGAACGAGFLPFEREAFITVIVNNVPQKFKGLNEKAFESGYIFAKSAEI